jgi:hypothetical protein
VGFLLLLLLLPSDSPENYCTNHAQTSESDDDIPVHTYFVLDFKNKNSILQLEAALLLI